MKIIDKAKALISNNEVKDTTKNFLEDVIAALSGDCAAFARIIFTLKKYPEFLREQLFWVKFDAFLNGVYIDEKDCEKLYAQLTEYGEKKDNLFRLVEYIDRAETQRKIKYLINATRCAITDLIDMPTYFRICHAITHTLEEDLHFLRNHIMESDLSYSQYVQGLINTGLMYQSIIDGNGEQQYSFTPIAKAVYEFAVGYDDVERYPNPKHISSINDNIQVRIPSLEWESFGEEKK